MAVSSVIGVFIVGTFFYYFLAWWVTLMIPAEVQKIYGEGGLGTDFGGVKGISR